MNTMKFGVDTSNLFLVKLQKKYVLLFLSLLERTRASNPWGISTRKHRETTIFEVLPRRAKQFFFQRSERSIK